MLTAHRPSTARRALSVALATHASDLARLCADAQAAAHTARRQLEAIQDGPPIVTIHAAWHAQSLLDKAESVWVAYRRACNRLGYWRALERRGERCS